MEEYWNYLDFINGSFAHAKSAKLPSPVKMAELQEDGNENDSLSKSALAGILAVSGIFSSNIKVLINTE